MSTETSPTVAPADAGGEDHLAAANEFFAAQQAPAKEPAKEPVKEPAKEVAKEPAKPDPLATVLKAAAKPEAPTAQAEAPTLEDIDKGLQAPPDNAKSRAGWDELKKRATEERKLRLELEAKLKTAGSPIDEATKARLAELETQNKTFSERLKVLDLKAHPEFHSRYVLPAEQAKLAMANIAKSDEVEVNLDEVLSLKGKALNKEVSEVMERMTPYARVKFQASLDAYFTAQAGADQALAQADESLKALKTTGGARSRASFDEVAGSYKDAFLPAPVDEKAPDPAASEYNQALSQIGARAETYAFGSLDDRGAADLAHKAALYEFTMAHGIPRIAALYNAELTRTAARVAELEAQVKGLTAASPQVGSGSGAPAEGESAAPDSHLSAAQKYFSR